jgi:hypothetical protein
MPAVPPTSSLPPPGLGGLGLAVLLTLFCHGALGASGCIPVPAAGTASTSSTTTTAQCVKAAKRTAKAKAKVSTAAPAAAAAAPAPASSWKSVLDPLPAGGWTYISDGPAENPSAVFASAHSIMHNGNVVTAWMRWEFARPQAEVYPLHYLSAVTREELDCDARSYRRAGVIYYTRNNLQEKGPSFTALDDDTTWKQAIPGSEPDAMLNWGCTLPTVAPKGAAAAKPAKAAVAPKPEAATGAASSAPAAAAGHGADLHTAR